MKSAGMRLGLIDEQTEERVRDEAANMIVAPEAVIRAAVTHFLTLDMHDQVVAVEKAVEEIARSRGWKPKSEPPPAPLKR